MIRLVIFVLFTCTLTFQSCINKDATSGDVLFEKGEYEHAILAYNEYLELYPSHVKTIYNRGRAYEELNRYDQALQDFKQVLKLDKKNVNAYLSIGNYHYRQERYDMAAFNYEKASGNNPGNAESRYLWGKALHKLSKLNLALEQFNHAISLNEDYGEAYLHRGLLYLNSKSHRKACADLKTAKALELDDAAAALAKYCK